MCSGTAEPWASWQRKVVAGGKRIVATARVYVQDVALSVDRPSGKNRRSGAWVNVYIQSHRCTG